MEDILRHSHRNLLALGMLAFLGCGCVSRTAEHSVSSSAKPSYGPATAASLSDYIRGVYKLSSEAGKAEEQKALLAQDESLVPLLERLEKDPLDEEARRQVVDAYMSQKLYWGAYDVLSTTLITNAQDPWVNFNLAVIWDAWGEYDLALQYGERAAASGNQNGRAFETLGRIHLHRNEPAPAITWYKRAFEEEPNASLLANMGYAYMLQSNWAAARTNLEAAVSLDDSLLEAHNNLAVVLSKTGDDAGALEQLQKAASPAVAMNNLGVLYLDEDRIESAENAFRESLLLDPSYEKAQKNLQDITGATPPPAILVLPSQDPPSSTIPPIDQSVPGLAQVRYPLIQAEPSGSFRGPVAIENPLMDPDPRFSEETRDVLAQVALDIPKQDQPRPDSTIATSGNHPTALEPLQKPHQGEVGVSWRRDLAVSILAGLIFSAGLVAFWAGRRRNSTPSRTRTEV